MPRKKNRTRADRELENKLKRERYANDPVYRQKIREYQRTYQKQRRRFDPEYRAARNAYAREYYSAPEWRAYNIALQTSLYHTNPEVRAKRLAASANYYRKRKKNDPAKYRAQLDRNNARRRAVTAAKRALREQAKSRTQKGRG